MSREVDAVTQSIVAAHKTTLRSVERKISTSRGPAKANDGIKTDV